jgi:hypothetical protein
MAGKPTTQVDEATARREFLRQIGKAAATAPAIALLLAASSKSASASNGPVYGCDASADQSVDGSTDIVCGPVA